ncbi:MAG: iron-sulfur cluster assembly scaffold protein [Betaproteobacteria bacterium]|nr:iron-sulfur cluster assembly scaffold protein [Betaproteobacteria bacterium]
MNDADSLYQDAIKQCARAAHGHGRLENVKGEAKLDNPLCGDRVRMQVALDGGRIAAVAHETKGCLLCRAAASLIGARAAGLDAAAVETLTGELDAMLKGAVAIPAGWPELAMFVPARAYPSRHRCVLLPFRALQAAIGKVGARDTAIPANDHGEAKVVI